MLSCVTRAQETLRRLWPLWTTLAVVFLGIPALCVIFLVWDANRPQEADLVAAAAPVAPEENGALRLEHPDCAVD